MKSLSGGERSFTNMCFIMAVGKQISSPFHCLDEFDVRPLWHVPPDLGCSMLACLLVQDTETVHTNYVPTV